jgi:predicted secreted protein
MELYVSFIMHRQTTEMNGPEKFRSRVKMGHTSAWA